MKLKHVFVVLGGLALGVGLLTFSAVARYEPSHYKFLGADAPKITELEPDPVGKIGRETRFYVIHKPTMSVAEEAQSELSAVGWKRLSQDPALFGRGLHERIDVRDASQYNDAQLLAGIPKSELSSYTVVKVTDPHMHPAIRHRFSRWARFKMRFLRHIV